jgi:hypothetical protein
MHQLKVLLKLILRDYSCRDLLEPLITPVAKWKQIQENTNYTKRVTAGCRRS